MANRKDFSVIRGGKGMQGYQKPGQVPVMRPKKAPVQPEAPKKAALPPIDNHELEELISAYSKEKNLKVLDEIREKLQTATVFVPGMMNPGAARPVPALIKTPDGKTIQPVYTSKEEILKAPATPAILCLPYVNINRAALAIPEEQLAGICLNPLSQNLTLKKKFMECVSKNESVFGILEPMRDQKAPDQEGIQALPTQVERMKFEGSFLPGKFFADPSQLIQKLKEEKEDAIDALFEESYLNKRMYPFRTDEFSIFAFMPEDHLEVLRINMPTRELYPGNALKIYMISGTEQSSYYMIVQGTSKDLHLLQVKADGSQADLGEAPAEGAELYTILQHAGIEML